MWPARRLHLICVSEIPFLPLGLCGPPLPWTSSKARGELRKGGQEKDAQWSLGESLLTAAQVPPKQIKVIQTPGAPAKPRSLVSGPRLPRHLHSLTQAHPASSRKLSLATQASSAGLAVPRGPSKSVLICPVTRGRHRAWTAYRPTHGGLVSRVELPIPACLL